MNSQSSLELRFPSTRALHRDRGRSIAIIEELDIRQAPVVTLSGEVDERSCARVAEVLYELYESGYPSPNVDMAGVSSIDHGGLEGLLHWCSEFHRGEDTFKIVSVNPHVRQVFETVGHMQAIEKLEDSGLPVTEKPSRQPITNCTAVAGNLEIMSFTVPARLESCKLVRDTISQAMSGMSFSDEDRCDAKLAVGEAITNAIKHGCEENPSETVTVRCLATNHRLVIEISDNGGGFDIVEVLSSPMNPEEREGGMGIRCMQHCMDEVSFDFDAGTTVRLVKRSSALS